MQFTTIVFQLATTIVAAQNYTKTVVELVTSCPAKPAPAGQTLSGTVVPAYCPYANQSSTFAEPTTSTASTSDAAAPNAQAAPAPATT